LAWARTSLTAVARALAGAPSLSLSVDLHCQPLRPFRYPHLKLTDPELDECSIPHERLESTDDRIGTKID
jgi:hypothetical protein